MKSEVKILIKRKFYYLFTFDNFILAQFDILIHTLKINYNSYKGYTIVKYYEMLGIGIL